MYFFINDYSEGCHPKILKTLTETNEEQTVGYGCDEYCAEAADLILKELDAPQSKVYFFRRLHLKDRFDAIKWKCELLIEFFYVVVKEFIGFIDIGYACESQLW